MKILGDPDMLYLAYSVEAIRQLEQLAFQQLDLSEQTLMERAGGRAWEFCQRLWPHAKSLAIFCGSGHNGGDGYVLARYAQVHGLTVTVYFVGELINQSALSAAQRLRALQEGVKEEALPIHTPEADIFVDAILGIGLAGSLRENCERAIRLINASQKPVLSLDVPSGLSADLGTVQNVAVKATATLSFIGAKRGLLTGVAREYVGHLSVDDLALPPRLFTQVKPAVRILEIEACKAQMPNRLQYAHKGAHGHLLVIGGDLGMGGAPLLAALAGLRIGSGLVSVVTHPQHVSGILSRAPEIMVYGTETPDTHFARLLERASVIALGPGLGQSSWSGSLFRAVIECEKPLVIDADGLNWLAETPRYRKNWVLTPHPGEAARLLACDTRDIEQDRFAAISNLAATYGGICLLKGAGTLISSQEAETIPALCPYGNPGMATGGMGDLLTGIIGGLIAQGLTNEFAATFGSCVHAYAADIVAQKQGQRGLLASDLLPELARCC